MIWNANDTDLGIYLTVNIDPAVAMRLPSQVKSLLTKNTDGNPVSSAILDLLRIAVYLEYEQALVIPYRDSWKRTRKLDQDIMVNVVTALADEWLPGQTTAFMDELTRRLQVFPTGEEGEEEHPPAQHVCKDCHGRGCFACEGTGFLPHPPDTTTIPFTNAKSSIVEEPLVALIAGDIVTCPACAGKGYFPYSTQHENISKACLVCNGAGRFPLTKAPDPGTIPDE